MNIVILGPPGSGKGTQARLLSEALNLFYFESGRFSRELAKENSRIRKIIKKGELIPEKEMTSYVSEYIEKMAPDAQNIIFDGYHRFGTQFKFLVRWFIS
jgi:adenylate kinase